ncbi:MAG: tetratricopeptide repeat protein [Planctomycetales bacterium]|nr:tetratricopeptide repeat protein [Planctomycetales bacterium]
MVDVEAEEVKDWKKLREVERYQMQIAEKYWREQNFKAAVAEYEKFMTLYEKSEGAPFAQLKWSLCQCQLKKQNTAIKEGFQSVIDYWPDSDQATASTFYIGHTYKEIGRTKEAKKSLREVVTKHPAHLATVYALADLIEIAATEKDEATQVELWKKMTFDLKRTPYAVAPCQQASRELAVHSFRLGAFEDGVKALATTYTPDLMPYHVQAYIRTPIAEMVADSKTKAKGEKLADTAVSWLKGQIPADITKPEGKALARQAWFAVGDVLAVALKDADVPPAYEQMHKLFAPDDEVLGRFATWYKSKAKYDQARDVYKRYADKNEGLGQIAYSYREQQNWAGAVQAYNQLIGQDAEHAVRWKPELAATQRAAHKWPEAIAVYEDLYSSDAKNSGKWRWEVAATHQQAGQLKEAIGHYRQCDNFPENYKAMAWCHRQLKQQNEAIILYNQVATHVPSAPWAFLQMAYCKEEAGQQEPAIQAFQKVCKKFPKDAHAGIAHAHLQQKYKISVTLGGAAEE